MKRIEVKRDQTNSEESYNDQMKILYLLLRGNSMVNLAIESRNSSLSEESILFERRASKAKGKVRKNGLKLEVLSEGLTHTWPFTNPEAWDELFMINKQTVSRRS